MGIDYRTGEPLPGTKLPQVSAGRVTLKRFTRADLDLRCAWPLYKDPVFAHLNLMLASPESRDRWFDREWRVRKPFWFAVEDEQGELIGSITLREISRWKRAARLGIHMHPERLDRGYGTEAMRLFLHYYFNLLGYKLLKLDVAAYNARAIRVYEKLGFVHQFAFWRSNLSGFLWLEDERFAHVRQFVENHRGLERIKHYEMHLGRESYLAQSGADGP